MAGFMRRHASALLPFILAAGSLPAFGQQEVANNTPPANPPPARPAARQTATTQAKTTQKSASTNTTTTLPADYYTNPTTGPTP